MKPSELLAELALYARERGREQDAPVVARFRQLLTRTAAPLSRAQFEPGHITCSACVLSADGGEVLLLHHAKLRRWLQPGGHVEPGDVAPLAAALREVREESGLASLALLPGPGGGALVDVDIHEIPARGPDPAHLHYDLRCALRACGDARLRESEESTALRWVPLARLPELTDELSVTRLVARSREWMG